MDDESCTDADHVENEHGSGEDAHAERVGRGADDAGDDEDDEDEKQSEAGEAGKAGDMSVSKYA